MYMYYLLGYKFTEKRTEEELHEHKRHRRRCHSTVLNSFDHRSYEKVLEFPGLLNMVIFYNCYNDLTSINSLKECFIIYIV